MVGTRSAPSREARAEDELGDGSGSAVEETEESDHAARSSGRLARSARSMPWNFRARSAETSRPGPLKVEASENDSEPHPRTRRRVEVTTPQSVERSKRGRKHSRSPFDPRARKDDVFEDEISEDSLTLPPSSRSARERRVAADPEYVDRSDNEEDEENGEEGSDDVLEELDSDLDFQVPVASRLRRSSRLRRNGERVRGRIREHSRATHDSDLRLVGERHGRKRRRAEKETFAARGSRSRNPPSRYSPVLPRERRRRLRRGVSSSPRRQSSRFRASPVDFAFSSPSSTPSDELERRDAPRPDHTFGFPAGEERMVVDNCMDGDGDAAGVAAAGGGGRAVGAQFQTLEGLESVGEVTWESVGGLDGHIARLKEMVLLPLLYPEVFDRFGVNPPRGVLFHGPPGTGKTLVARALACEVSKASKGQAVSFFMRKGADCLSKWVGEAERQLRLLFAQAVRSAPSIIFFDEIDGLAPARSSRHDHTHNSVVATLLALLDSCGRMNVPATQEEARGSGAAHDASAHAPPDSSASRYRGVIVLGATNRIDALDPALRRPGRFDRELLFTLPSCAARREILGIHTRGWNPPPTSSLLDSVTERTSGMSGADLRAVATEAALAAFRRCYPQVYSSDKRLLIDPSVIEVNEADFDTALRGVVATSTRTATTAARPLPPGAESLLGAELVRLQRFVGPRFPVASAAWSCTSLSERREVGVPHFGVADSFGSVPSQEHALEELESEKSDRRCADGTSVAARESLHSDEKLPKLSGGVVDSVFLNGGVHRPRVLICGPPRMGQELLGAALLHAFDGVACYDVSWAALHSHPSGAMPEHALALQVSAALASAPSALLLPDAFQWWERAPSSLQHSLVSLLAELPPQARVLVVAAAQEPLSTVRQSGLSTIFPEWRDCAFVVRPPTSSERGAFFEKLMQRLSAPPAQLPEKPLPLPLAPPTPARCPTQFELAEDAYTMCQFRMALRKVVSKLKNNRMFRAFVDPVDREALSDYERFVKNPLCLREVEARVNEEVYAGPELLRVEFRADLDLVVSNALIYNPEHDPCYNKALALRDEITVQMHRLDRSLLSRVRLAHARASRRSQPAPIEPVATVDVAVARTPPRTRETMRLVSAAGLHNVPKLVAELDVQTEMLDVDALLELWSRMMSCVGANELEELHGRNPDRATLVEDLRKTLRAFMQRIRGSDSFLVRSGSHS